MKRWVPGPDNVITSPCNSAWQWALRCSPSTPRCWEWITQLQCHTAQPFSTCHWDSGQIKGCRHTGTHTRAHTHKHTVSHVAISHMDLHDHVRKGLHAQPPQTHTLSMWVQEGCMLAVAHPFFTFTFIQKVTHITLAVYSKGGLYNPGCRKICIYKMITLPQLSFNVS